MIGMFASTLKGGDQNVQLYTRHAAFHRGHIAMEEKRLELQLNMSIPSNTFLLWDLRCFHWRQHLYLCPCLSVFPPAHLPPDPHDLPGNTSSAPDTMQSSYDHAYSKKRLSKRRKQRQRTQRRSISCSTANGRCLSHPLVLFAACTNHQLI